MHVEDVLDLQTHRKLVSPRLQRLRLPVQARRTRDEPPFAEA